MSLRPLIPLVVLPLVLSAAGMAYAASQGERTGVILAAVLFTVIVIAVTGIINRPYWAAASSAPPPDALFHTMRRNTRLAALVYAWAALAFYLIYGLSGVTWRHGLQYGTGAALIAAALIYYVRRMGQPGHGTPPSYGLTLAHGYAVSLGLVFLVGSGKLATMKGDWAANYIFLFGGLALIGICFMAARTHRLLSARA